MPTTEEQNVSDAISQAVDVLFVHFSQPLRDSIGFLY